MSALTKMMIVLSLLFSLITSVVLVLGVSKLTNYKTQTDDANTAKVAASASLADSQRQNAALTAQLAQAQQAVALANSRATQAEAGRTNDKSLSDAEILGLKSQLATANATVASLTASNGTLTAINNAQTTELTTVRPLVAKLTTDNSELSRQVNETSNQLRAAEMAIRKLQEQQITSSSGPAGSAVPMGSEGQISTVAAAASAGKVNGQISEVNTATGNTIIGLPLGTRDGIQPNTKLAIYRGNSYVADAVVQRATPDESVATVTKTKPGAVVQKGDLVTTVGQ